MCSSFREKKRERDREELWKKLHELESSRVNNKMIKNSSNSDTIQNPTNTSSTSTTNPTTISSASSASINSATNSTNQSGGGVADTTSSYNINKKDNVLKEE